jgi:hypothetical protein
MGRQRKDCRHSIYGWGVAHIVMTHTGGVMSAYKDGAFVNSVATGDLFIGDTADYIVHFGKLLWAGSSDFNSTIDDPRL